MGLVGVYSIQYGKEKRRPGQKGKTEEGGKGTAGDRLMGGCWVDRRE